MRWITDFIGGFITEFCRPTQSHHASPHSSNAYASFDDDFDSTSSSGIGETFDYSCAPSGFPSPGPMSFVPGMPTFEVAGISFDSDGNITSSLS